MASSLLFSVFTAALSRLCHSEHIIADSKSTAVTCQGSEDCSIYCGTISAGDGDTTALCAQRTINCPPDPYTCSVQCVGKNACSQATMNWDSIGSLSASGYSAVEYVTFPRPDPNTPLNITCPDSYTCYHAKIYCPLNADCRVNCVGYHACVGATFYFSPSPTARFDLHCDDSQDACGESQKRAINTTTTQTPISTSSTSSTTSTSTQSSTSTASTSALSTGFQTTAVSSESSNMAKVEKQIQILSVAVIVLSILMFCVLLIGLGYCMTNGRIKKRTKGAYVEFSKDESA